MCSGGVHRSFRRGRALLFRGILIYWGVRETQVFLEAGREPLGLRQALRLLEVPLGSVLCVSLFRRDHRVHTQCLEDVVA